MTLALAGALGVGCGHGSARDAVDAGHDAAACQGLFGVPNASTGLDASVCRPECTCGGDTWAPPATTLAEIDALAQRVLLNPPALLTSDPYAHPESFPAHPNEVCGVLPDASKPGAYRLETYASAAAATAAGATVTHTSACGQCSSLADLAVYMRNNDLTTPVRNCALQATPDAGAGPAMACLEALGFDQSCAQIWYYDALNTRAHCLQPCLADLSKPYQTPDAALNACLECDETESGPVFKAVAGRTRRNSGLPSAICRPCSSVSHVAHVYP
jgi:hypothetical protein